jgi:putative ABC transport system substrate-binding protein
MISRRRLLKGAALSIFGTPFLSTAQPQVARIGYLGQNSASAPSMPVNLRAFREGLRALGYVENQNLVVEYRWAEGKPERLARLAADLIGLKIDAIVCVGPAGVKAVRGATASVPIVTIDLETDPVASGAVASLARPGGNLTGIFLDQAELSGKWLQLLRDAIPTFSRAAVLWDSANPSPQLKAIEVAARTMGIYLQALKLQNLEQLEAAFATAKKGRTQGLVVLSSPLFGSSGPRLGDLALEARLPAISPFRELTAAGLLMAYGPNVEEGFRRLAAFIAKILTGEKPRDIAIERPSRFDLVINARTAKAIGLTLPQALLLRADQVIE